MKRLILVTLIATSSTALFSFRQVSEVTVLSEKMDIFYFKVSKAFVGATVVVYSADDSLIFTSKVLHRKVIIDFYLKAAGVFTIKVKKDNKEEVFTYVKEDGFQLQPIDTSMIDSSVSIFQ